MLCLHLESVATSIEVTCVRFIPTNGGGNALSGNLTCVLIISTSGGGNVPLSYSRLFIGSSNRTQPLACVFSLLPLHTY